MFLKLGTIAGIDKETTKQNKKLRNQLTLACMEIWPIMERTFQTSGERTDRCGRMCGSHQPSNRGAVTQVVFLLWLHYVEKSRLWIHGEQHS